MLGHKLAQMWRERFEVFVTLRSDFERFARFGIFDSSKTLTGVSAEDFDSVINAFGSVQPDVVVNCIGVIKQLETAKDPVPTLTVNAIFPHLLAKLCQTTAARLISLSTDCVFSGKKGNYAENETPDASDLYGQSKRWGEVAGENCLTVRSSIIGREIDSAHSLVEWFLSNRGGRVRGFTNAVYSGFPTVVMADILADLIENHRDLNGLWQISSEPINKFELIKLINKAFEARVEIEPYEDFYCDRSLDSSRFRHETGFMPESWSEMVRRMAADPTPYDEWRSKK